MDQSQLGPIFLLLGKQPGLCTDQQRGSEETSFRHLALERTRLCLTYLGNQQRTIELAAPPKSFGG